MQSHYTYPYYTVDLRETENRTTRTGHRKRLLEVKIWNEREHRGVVIQQMVDYIDRESYVEDCYRTAIDTLNGQGNCCFQGKVKWL